MDRPFPCRQVEACARWLAQAAISANECLPLPREAVAIFTTYDERLDHFGAFEVSLKFAQLVQPEAVTTGIRVSPEVASAIIAKLQKQSSHRFAAPYAIALIESGLGSQDRALDCLEKAYEAKDEWLVWLNVDPRLDHLRKTARFRKLAGKLGFIAQASN